MSLLHFTAVFATSTTPNFSEMEDESTQRFMASYIDSLPSVPAEENLLAVEAYGDLFFQQKSFEAARSAYKYITRFSNKARVSFKLAETLSMLGYYYDTMAEYHGELLAKGEQVHCLNGHHMMKPTQNLDRFHFCNGCGKGTYLVMIKKRCEECDYDLCKDCVNTKITAHMAAQWAASNLERLEEVKQQTSIPNNIGSQNHGQGCTPCAWFYKATGCTNENSCVRCHRCEDGELKKRKQAKKMFLRDLKQNQN